MIGGLPKGHPSVDELKPHMRAVLEGLTLSDLLEIMRLLKESEPDNTGRCAQTSRAQPTASTCKNPAKASSSKVKIEQGDDDGVGDLDFDSLAIVGHGCCAACPRHGSSNDSLPEPVPELPFALPTDTANEFYAVRAGRQVGIFRDWGFTSAQVVNVRGAIHKKFSNYWDAYKFFHAGTVKIIL